MSCARSLIQFPIGVSILSWQRHFEVAATRARAIISTCLFPIAPVACGRGFESLFMKILLNLRKIIVQHSGYPRSRSSWGSISTTLGETLLIHFFRFCNARYTLEGICARSSVHHLDLHRSRVLQPRGLFLTRSGLLASRFLHAIWICLDATNSRTLSLNSNGTSPARIAFRAVVGKQPLPWFRRYAGTVRRYPGR